MHAWGHMHFVSRHIACGHFVCSTFCLSTLCLHSAYAYVSPHLRSGHLDIEDVQCAKNKDRRKISVTGIFPPEGSTPVVSTPWKVCMETTLFGFARNMPLTRTFSGCRDFLVTVEIRGQWLQFGTRVLKSNASEASNKPEQRRRGKGAFWAAKNFEFL